MENKGKQVKGEKKEDCEESSETQDYGALTQRQSQRVRERHINALHRGGG